jgi:uncharacterized membrane protein YoaK (UPF0700 family)
VIGGAGEEHAALVELFSSSAARPCGARARSRSCAAIFPLSRGIQAVGARSISASGINTIVFTSVLVRIVMSIADALVRRASGSASLAGIGPHLVTFAGYGRGALLAGALVTQHLETMIWVPVAAVMSALGLSELSAKLERSTR